MLLFLVVVVVLLLLLLLNRWADVCLFKSYILVFISCQKSECCFVCVIYNRNYKSSHFLPYIIQSPKCSSSESTIQGPCQASHGYNSSTRSPQAFSSFSLMHSEIGPSSGYGGGDACCQGNQHAGHPHGFPAHAAAINKSHLSPLAENIQVSLINDKWWPLVNRKRILRASRWRVADPLVIIVNIIARQRHVVSSVRINP